jgi:pimeloyl-ACP methyl ester carboxylesterase
MDGRENRPKPAPPALRLTLRDAAAALLPTPPFALRLALQAAPRGDGHPVLVLPAFLHGDAQTRPLRRFLAGCGYLAYGWGLRRNIGPTDAVLLGLERRLDEIGRRHGRRVSLIGHSLGGVLARELAKARPQDVRQLILLASPVVQPTASPLEPVYRLLARWHSDAAARSPAQLNAPPEVPVTAIFTRTDGIVAWRSCLEASGPHRECVEVRGAHGTLVRNPAAWRIIADRLAQPEGAWRPHGGVDRRPRRLRNLLFGP